MDEELEPPPTNEAEEIERRARIPILTLVRWYIRRGLRLDVPLTLYRPRGGDNG